MPPARKYETAEQMQVGIDAYFADCEARGKPATVSGLSLALGFTNRHSLLRYLSEEMAAPDEEKRAFSATIKRAKARIEAQIEEGLLEGKSNPVGKIFNLKNNFGWVDRQETHSTQDTRIQVEVVGMPQLPASAVAVLQGQPQAIEGELVTGLVTDTDDDVVDAEVTAQDD